MQLNFQPATNRTANTFDHRARVSTRVTVVVFWNLTRPALCTFIAFFPHLDTPNIRHDGPAGM